MPLRTSPLATLRNHEQRIKANNVDNKKNGLVALLFDNLTGIEVFFMLLLGQIGQSFASGKPIHYRVMVGNLLLNAVFTNIIIQVGAWREWDTPQILIVGGIVGVLGVNLTVQLLKKQLERAL